MAFDQSAAHRRVRRVALILLAACGLAWVALLAHGVSEFGGRDVRRFFSDGVYMGLMIGASSLVLIRALLVRRERAAWFFLAAGMSSWTVADMLWVLDLGDATKVPVPNIADLFYYLYYPLIYVGLALLMKARNSRAGAAIWFDGVVVALALAAVFAAFVVEPVATAQFGDKTAAVVSLGYVLLDLVTLAIAGLAVCLAGLRPGRGWLLVLAFLVASVLADGWYGLAAATGGDLKNPLLETLWPLAALALAAAAWQPAQRSTQRRESIWLVGLTGLAALSALGLLVAAPSIADAGASAPLAAATLVAAMLRFALELRRNSRLVAHSREQALTDGLTGLGNRRRLLEALDFAFSNESPERPRALVFCDLDGFKAYNDGFGHGAGDVLLSRIGMRLRETTGADGEAFRLGGDEFCVLLESGAADSADRIARLAAALRERGNGFAIGASLGVVELPTEADNANAALQLADERMYAQKESRRPNAKQQARELLIRVLAEREPELRKHMRDVAELAVGVARRVGLSSEEIDEVARGAELHDVGKLAIPDAVLHKPAPLDDIELQMIRQHTITGERILSAAPAMRPVARIVRSSHERWDGGGYPDRLAGEEIPIGARIVAVCDAFDAMVTERPYAAARSEEDAVAELRHCAGTQFDPTVVTAFITARDSGASYGRVVAESPAGDGS